MALVEHKRDVLRRRGAPRILRDEERELLNRRNDNSRFRVGEFASQIARAVRRFRGALLEAVVFFHRLMI